MTEEPDAELDAEHGHIVERMVHAICSEFGDDAPLFAMMLEIHPDGKPKQVYFGTNTESPRDAHRLLSMGLAALRGGAKPDEPRRKPRQRRRRP